MVSCDASEIDAQVKKLTEPCQDPRLRDYPNRFVAMTVDLEDGRFFSFFLVFVLRERGKGREGGKGEREGERKEREEKGGKGRGRKWEREEKGVGEGKGREKEGEVERESGKRENGRKRKKREKGEKQVALMLWACMNYWKNLRTLIRGLFPNRS